MRTVRSDHRETHTVASAVVLLTLGVAHAAPSSSAVTRTPPTRAHDTIRLGHTNGGRVTALTITSLTAPAFDSQMDAYAFAIDAHNTSGEAIDWILGIELRSSTSDAREVTLAARTSDRATWSAPLTIDTSGNPAFCAVSPLMPSVTQTVRFRVRVPRPADVTHLSLEASTAQSSSRTARPRPRTRLLSLM